MSEHVERTIEMVLNQIGDLEREVARKKNTVNDLCAIISRPPMFLEIAGASATQLTDDAFYGKPLAAAVEEVFERRKQAGQGAATVAEIYDTLIRGGFHFTTKNVENAKRGLYISLTKNALFHKLPNGSYGLLAWYPNVPQAKKIKDDAASGDKPCESIADNTNGANSGLDEAGLAEAKTTFEEVAKETTATVKAKAK
jgi:hypothetical protein